jgi:glyoxylase-like metal-dependent hydrolase (beta-lactamase superfamily II)
MVIEDVDRELEYIDVVPDKIVTTSLFPHETNQILRSFESANMSCIALEDELIFVDCGAIVDNARKFRADMEDRFGLPTTHLLLTHEHWHAAWGMQAFEDVNIVISRDGLSYIRTNLKKDGYANLKEAVLREMPDDEQLRDNIQRTSLIIPHIGVPREKPFILGPQTDQVIFRSDIIAHSGTSAIIHAPSAKVLFTGGTLVSYGAQQIRITWIDRVYRELEKLEFDKIIPGHGPVVDKSYIAPIREYYEKLVAQLWEFKQEGLTEKQVTKRFDELPEYPGKRQKSWIEGSRYHTQELELTIKSMYRQVLREATARDSDLMFIS